MNSIKVGLCGLGTVGSGVVHLLYHHQEKIMHDTGSAIEIKGVLVSDLSKVRAGVPDGIKLTDQREDILGDDSIDLIVEVMGGVEDAYQLIKGALQKGKHVVTANKDLMAVHGAELLAIANENMCDLRYEASVAGGIPIIRSLTDGLASDKIHKVVGILNGTTNYILTKMVDEGRSFEDVLKEAQELGFAEADPTSDVDGLDAARKVVLLATLAFSMPVELEDVSVKGIRNLSSRDIDYAEQLGYTLKLVGIAARDQERVELSVQPTFIANNHPLASVKNEYNAVYVYGDAVGETMFFGPGAGQLPTATAVVSDVMDVVKNIRLGVTGQSSFLPQYEKRLKPSDEVVSKYYVRLEAKDQTGTFLEITNVFAQNEVSFDKILQLPLVSNEKAEIVMVTHRASEHQLERILNGLEQLDVVEGVSSYYRIEGEGA
ncbi:homoserine dehydrogenase [Pontibacillus halophilus JSM 076056 = DSM 19796]|uniref:Homoserine dehydrogenase n=1 Tax=Pontibacillus halophilus JSM 076056 = DSM 19796 TaxID=1385510 RepID=A0A0A5GEI5_9BACI|nr:homoserine dehydrogenase [Pontibacillus halophilus]KGX89628.1 homoserine dehydrogenase [Pontibacillus halophilus JSM 076056 = DSM 19796]